MNFNPIQASGASTPSIVKDPNDALGKDEFLKLLLEQLKNQDPAKPMEDREFIAQLAQFRNLEQTQQMNANLEKLLDFQQFSLASGLIGKSVEAEVDGRTIDGTVADVLLRHNRVLLTIGSEEVDMSAITKIQQAASPQEPAVTPEEPATTPEDTQE